MTEKDSKNETLIGFHLIRKSANALASNFSDSQITNILGQIEEVEQNIAKICLTISKKANNDLV